MGTQRIAQEPGAVVDRDGWPVREGARIYVGPRVTGLSSYPISGERGRVARTYQDPRHGGVIEFYDGAGCLRTVRSDAARVQGQSRRQTAQDVEVQRRVRRGRVNR